MAVKRDHKEVCNAFANLRQALGDSRMLDSLYQFIDTYKLADYVEDVYKRQVFDGVYLA